MRVHAESYLETDLLSEVKQFQVKVSQKTFAVLTKDIYKNPKLAIVRELACNAWDAHLAAGTEDVPFEVYFPTVTASDFIVKDFGTGLPKEAVMELYTTYFGSDKDKTNEYTGGFGLGSKTPFAYTDQFTVESRFDNKKHIFSAFIDGQGVPSIAHIRSDDTNEPNGLTVIVPAKAGDFVDSLACLRWFPTLPKIIGAQLELTKPKWTHITAEYGIYEKDELDAQIYDDYYSNHVLCLMGNVAYGTPLNILNHTGYRMVLLANIGDYDIQVSREALNIDAKEVLRPLVFKAKEDFIKIIKERIEKEATTDWDRFKMYAAFSKGDLIRSSEWPDACIRYLHWFKWGVLVRGRVLWAHHSQLRTAEQATRDVKCKIIISEPHTKYTAVAKNFFAEDAVVFIRPVDYQGRNILEAEKSFKASGKVYTDLFPKDQLIDPCDGKYKIKRKPPGKRSAASYTGTAYAGIIYNTSLMPYTDAKALSNDTPVAFYNRQQRKSLGTLTCNAVFRFLQEECRIKILCLPDNKIMRQRFRKFPFYLEIAWPLLAKKYPIIFQKRIADTKPNFITQKGWYAWDLVNRGKKEFYHCHKLAELFKRRVKLKALQDSFFTSTTWNKAYSDAPVLPTSPMGFAKEYKYYRRMLAQYPALVYMLEGANDRRPTHNYMRDQNELYPNRKIFNAS